MSFKGILKIGKRYEISIASDPSTPGMSAVVIGWVPPVGSSSQVPVVDTVDPGMTAVHAGIIPGSQMLVIDYDLPDKPGARITISVKQGSTLVASGTELNDGEWTFMVQP